MLGKLDEEIALARTNLARFQRSVEGSSKSGIPTAVSDGGRSITIRPYADIVQQHLELIGRLEERRSRMLAQANPTDAGHSGPVTWSFHPADEVALDVPHPAPGDPGGDDADAGE